MTLSKDSVQIAIVIKKDMKALLQDYAKVHHWSMSQAAALLIQRGLQDWKEQRKESQPSDEIL